MLLYINYIYNFKPIWDKLNKSCNYLFDITLEIETMYCIYMGKYLMKLLVVEEMVNMLKCTV